MPSCAGVTGDGDTVGSAKVLELSAAEEFDEVSAARIVAVAATANETSATISR
ncbi:hypothetical protein GCM10023235_32450 [Kitasatospora terrestris]|uniref:FXSXX-COOH protein n=1 Tax=Kitasatospora terrestris TaxID=258051 RepID=A0ABP9DRN8_9ACTN